MMGGYLLIIIHINKNHVFSFIFCISIIWYYISFIYRLLIGGYFRLIYKLPLIYIFGS